MATPKWAQDLIIDAMCYLETKNYPSIIPDIKWRRRVHEISSSGACFDKHIAIRAGDDRNDCKMVVLHELAHWVLYLQKGVHVGHTACFWDLTWDLFAWAKLPMRKCYVREASYRKGSVTAYKRRIRTVNK